MEVLTQRNRQLEERLHALESQTPKEPSSRPSVRNESVSQHTDSLWLPGNMLEKSLGFSNQRLCVFNCYKLKNTVSHLVYETCGRVIQ